MSKVDLKKELDSFSAKRGEFRVLDVPARQYLMVDGHGDPNTQQYADALAVLYPVAYALKFASKKQLSRDYVVPPLEALWWADDMEVFTARVKSRWDWTAMILTPDWIPASMVAEARRGDVRLETFSEGRCVQTLHVGSYDDETPVIAAMHDFIAENDMALSGKHHEIYLSDPRRVAPEKLRTILRQPVSP